MLVRPAEGVHVAVVEVEEVAPVFDVRVDDGLLLQSAIADDGVVDGNASELPVCVVVGGDERVRYVWYVVSGVGLSCDVGRPALEFKGRDEVAPEAGELFACIC